MKEGAQLQIDSEADADIHVYPLSFSQQQLWFLQSFDPQLTAYNLPRVFKLRGALNVEALGRAFQALIDRHAVLRTRFDTHDGVARQLVLPHLAFQLAFEDLTNLTSEQARVRAAEAVDEIVKHVFDLGRAPLLVAKVIRTGPDQYLLACCLHHIISDGWSNAVIAADLARAYERALKLRGPVHLAEPEASYGEYAKDQREGVANGALAQSLQYWSTYLEGELPSLELPTDRPRPATQTFNGAAHEFAIAPSLAARVQELCRSERCTPFVVMLAAWQVLLARCCDQQEILIGVPTAGRRREELQELVGFFVTTQVFRARCTPEKTFRQICRQVRADTLAALEHDDVPLEMLLDARHEKRDSARNPLFQALFDLRVVNDDSVLSLACVVAEVVPVAVTTAKFDLALGVSIDKSEVRGKLEYNADILEARSAAWLCDGYVRVLDVMLTDPEQVLAELSIVSETQRQQLERWQRNTHSFPDTTAVHTVIERQVHATPAAAALVFGEIKLSYVELNALANRLAHRLMQLGVRPEVTVGIAVERSVEMVVGVLAIMKAGGAYLPMDPEYPAERLRYMMESSGVRLVLTQAALLPLLPSSSEVTLLSLDTLDVSNESDVDPRIELHPENLAYVIYTSGSTGRPKGAANRHGALHNRLAWMQETYELRPDDTVLQKTPFSFDVSVWEFFWPLMSGARLVMAPPGAHREPEQLVDLIGRHQVSTLHFVPSMLQAFLEHEATATCSSVKRIICSGEALPIETQRRVFQRLPWTRLYNLYGPTEAAIDVTHWTCVEEESGAVPIGQPIASIRTVVLDSQLQFAAPGTPGELYLGGVGLARGYLHRAALTAERFVADPCSTTGERLYRTGDRVRWREDGELEYLGRVDHQVKIRGFRIELGEIDTHLLAQPEVREAVTVARQGPNGLRLIAYVSSNTDIDIASLRGRLSTLLPDYMVPSAIVALARLPLNANGKIDRSALPEPGLSPTESFIEPQGPAEQALASIWAQVLRVERVARHDNFFALGGDSILSLQIVARARAASWRITPRQVFERQTLADLASVADAIQEQVPQEQECPQGELPLLPVQKWFFAQEVPQRHHWNQSLLLYPREPLQADQLRAALHAVVGHHDSFRLRYRQEEAGQWIQWYAEGQRQGDELLWLREADHASHIEPTCSQAQRSLNLASGPLVRAVLIAVADGTQRLLLVIHHLIVDAVSWRILLEDLHHAYVQGANVALPASTSSYQHWARHVQTYACEHAEELPYWRALAVAPAWPVDFPSGTRLVGDQVSVSAHLDRARTRLLLTDAPVMYRAQVNDLLLTALSRALCQWTGQSQVIVDVEGHGRHTSDFDLSRSVGWFTVLYPVALGTPTDVSDALKRTKEALRRTPNGGLGYGAFFSATPSFVLFNYLGQFDGDFGEKALWTPAAESAGAPIDPGALRPHEFSITGQVYRGELRLNVSYSSKRYRHETVQAWVAHFQAELASLVDHCMSVPATATPSDFPWVELSQQQLDALPVALANVETLYPMTPLQRGLLFHRLRDTDSSAYINQLRVTIEGLDVARFEAAWRAVLQRHEALRAGFIDPGELALQWIARDVSLPLRTEHMPEADEQQLQWRADAEVGSFDLARPPLMRLLLIDIDGHRHHLIWTFAHVLIDGWSAARLMGDLLHIYSGEQLAPLRCRYRDYVAWIAGRDHSAAREYWTAQLQKLDEPTRLLDSWSTVRCTEPAEHVHVLTEELSRRLEQCARRERVTLNTLMQAAWALLLSRCTGRGTVVFGSTTSGRPAGLPGVEGLVGLFINTFPVIVELGAARCVGDWLRELQANNAAAREHEHTPLFEIQQWAGRGGQVLFDTLLVFENYPVDEVLAAQGTGELRFSAIQHRDQAHYPLTVVVDQGERVTLRYRSGMASLARSSLMTLAGAMQRLLESFATSTQRPLGTIVLAEAAPRSLPAAVEIKPVHRRIEHWAQRQPHATAVICGDQTISYEQLNTSANRLAHRLIALGVKPESRVGVALERGLDLVIAILAILKSGGAYVPMDPAYPHDRIEGMMRDSGIQVLVTQRGLTTPATNVCVLHIDAIDVSGEPTDDPRVPVHDDTLAYVIYTSGSTGQPKGAQLCHGNVARLLDATQAWFRFDERDAWTLFHSYAFDFSVWEILGALCHGARLVVVPYQVSRCPEEFLQLLREQRITVLNQTPSAFKQLMEVPALYEQDGLALRVVIFGGEALDPRSLQRWLSHFGDASPRLINMYGITETTVHVTFRPITKADLEPAGSPIGEAIPDLGLSVMDAHLQSALDGAQGELFVAGAGLARGYLNRPGLTAERFVADPFDSNGGRMYRTGDLARRRHDGELEYLGRADEQVKIRGFRIELGEIEAKLLQIPEVRQAVVLARDTDASREECLVAYLVASPDPQLVERLRAHLQQSLPDYMLPASYIQVDSMPLNANGKVDRKALLALAGTQLRASYVAPRDELEARLAELWKRVLSVERVGAHDSFFELGGHSLSATQMITHATRMFGVELPLRLLFDAGDLASFAQKVRDRVGERRIDRHALMPVERHGALPLSHAQQRLWFLWKLEPQSAAFNIPLAVHLTGDLNEAALNESFDGLLGRHEVLRSRFSEEGGVPGQIAGPPAAVAIERVELRDLAQARDFAERWVLAPFNLETGPLLRVLLVRLNAREHVLLVAFHHIVADGRSIGIVMREFAALYDAHSTARQPQLPPMPLQYGDYAVWHRRWLEDGEMDRQLQYWRRQLQGAEVLELSTDRPRPAASTQRGASHRIKMSPELTQRLVGVARQQQVTMFTLILAAFSLVLRRRSGQSAFLIGTNVENRPHPQLQPLVGFFVNQLVLKVSFAGTQCANELLGALQSMLVDALEHQDLPFDRLVEALHPPRRGGRAPFFNVKVIYQTAATDSIALPGLQAREFAMDRNAIELDLIAEFFHGVDGLQLNLAYSTDLFEPATAACLAEQVVAVLQRWVERDNPSLEWLDDAVAELQRQRHAAARQQRSAQMSQIRPVNRRRATRGVPDVVFRPFHDARPLLALCTPGVRGMALEHWAATHRREIDESLRAHGAILFRDFDVSDAAAFHRCIDAMCGEALEYRFRSSPRTQVDPALRIYTSTEYPAAERILPHNENSYAAEFPSRLLFYCHTPASSGGETPIGDVRAVLRRMDKQVREQFARRQVLYVRNFGDGLGLSWQEVFQTARPAEVEQYCSNAGIEVEWLSDGRLRTRRRGPAIIRHPRTGELCWFNHAVFFNALSLPERVRDTLLGTYGAHDLPQNTFYGDGAPIEPEVIAHLQQLYREQMIEFTWRRGDVLLLDNLVTAHARNAFTGARKILVGMAGVERASELAVAEDAT